MNLPSLTRDPTIWSDVKPAMDESRIVLPRFRLPSPSSSPPRSMSGMLPTMLPTSLPTPTSILRSNQMPRCFACGKEGCSLATHKRYTQSAMSRLDTTSSSPSQRIIHTSHLNNPGARPKQFTLLPRQVEHPLIDPYASYPIPMNRETHRLLDLWRQPWGQTHRGPQHHLFPQPVINSILPYAMKYAPLFQSLLAVAAAQSSLACGKIDELALRHQQSAIQLHAKASRDEKSASSDANILTGLAIMSNYLAQGKLFEAERHMEGINHLVRLRGGPQYLEMDGIVANYVMYYDQMSAVYNDQEPVWKMPLPSLKFDYSFAPRLGSGFEAILRTESHDIEAELAVAAKDLCRLAELLDLGVHGKIPLKELNVTSYLSTVSEYQLSHLNALYHGLATRSECVCLALLLFDEIVLRNTGSVSPGVRKIEEQFWVTFQAAQTKGLWETENGALLIWVLLTGLTVEVRAECPWHSFAIESLRKARAEVIVRGWKDVKKIFLDPFIWCPMAQDEVFREIWMEVENPKLSKKNADFAAVASAALDEMDTSL